MGDGKNITDEKKTILDYLSGVSDPEIPVINIVELGIVRDVEVAGSSVIVNITPTYSGCPAMKLIKDEIVSHLNAKGYTEVTVNTVYSPAWTTEWMSEETKEKLKNYGVAPPNKMERTPFVPLYIDYEKVPCPFCNSNDTLLKSRFGSTACKSFYYCNSCRQLFEHFKSF